MNTPADRLPGADEENIVPESEGLAADVPAGAAGADSGAVDAARIDPDDEARIQGISSQNDLPGVGTRAADGLTERGTDDARGESGSTSRHTEDADAPDATHPAPRTTSAAPRDGAPRADRDTDADTHAARDTHTDRATGTSGDAGTAGEPHVSGDDPIAAFQPGVGRDSAASSRIAQNLPDPDDA